MSMNWTRGSMVAASNFRGTRMRVFILMIALGLPSYTLAAEADLRALESCKKTSKVFTEIAKCLPDADVAVAVLDEFDRVFDTAAIPLKTKCIELNEDDVSGASTCVLNAIKDAVSLKLAMPKGSDIGDPIFDAVSNEALLQKLRDTENAARKKYPEVRLWGGGMYMPYR